MSMTKLILPGSYDFGEPMTQLVKVSSRGLIGGDRQQFEKRSSAEFVHKIASLEPGRGVQLIHLIALGATERYNANRNGDGFRRATCRECHPTFTKYARFYRHHRNKDPKKSYGIIKLSHYNDDMDRVELVVGLNATEEAAANNGGLVADEEMEKLARGDDLGVSMAAIVPFDICSSCGNKAKTRANYCGPEMCKHGGLRDNMGKVFADGHVLHADNPDPRFFDISNVFRPADRIGYVLGKVAAYEEFVKAASETEHPLGGAALAEQFEVTPPFWVPQVADWTDQHVIRQLKTAAQLVELEEQQPTAPHAYDRAFSSVVQQPVSDFPDIRRTTKLAHVMQALVNANCLLPLSDFVALLAGGASEKTADAATAAADWLPGAFSRLAESVDLQQRLQRNPYLPHGMPSRNVRGWVTKHAAAWSLDRERVLSRAQLSVLRDARAPRLRETTKTAAVTPGAAAQLAEEYALYQLAFLQSQPTSAEAELTPALVVRQNYLQ